jgi:hypothetical protein
VPYSVRKKGSKWAVVNKKTGRVLGKHTSKKKAVAQLKAVYMRTGGK